MSNGNGEFDAFEAGFDVTPDISDEEAIDFKIVSDLGEIGEELDALMQGLVSPAVEEGRIIGADAAQLRTELSVAMAAEIVILEDETNALRASLIEVADTEAAILNNEVIPLADTVNDIDTSIGTETVCRPNVETVISRLEEMLVEFGEDPQAVLFFNAAIDIAREHGRHELTHCLGPTTGIFSFEWRGLGVYSNGIAVQLLNHIAIGDPGDQYRSQATIVWACTTLRGVSGSALGASITQTQVLFESFEAIAPGCFASPICVCKDDDITPAPIPEPEETPGPEPIPEPVPITPPCIEICEPEEECPEPEKRVIVALDCDTRLLIVINADELCGFPNAIELVECVHGSEFDYDELCKICDEQEEVEEEEEPPPRIIVPGIEFDPALDIECKLPAVNTLRVGGAGDPHPRIHGGGITGLLDVIKQVFGGSHLLSLFGGRPAGVSLTPESIANALVGKTFAGLRNMLADWNDFQAELARKALQVKGCLGTRSVDLMVSRFAVAFINQWTGGTLKEELKAYDQQIAQDCPTSIPTSEQALSAWLANRINVPQLKCWVEANNFRWDEWKHVADSAQKKPGILELLGMWRRNLIDDDDLLRMSRNDGWVNQPDVERFVQLTEFIPGPSDLVRFMVRDVADEVNIDWTESDRTFQQKFAGPMLDWAKAQAIDTETMKFQWRAHWRIPSPTQLFTMMHRLGRNRDGTIVPEFRKRVRQALEQDDVMPNWVDELMAINFSLPRLSQIRRLLRSGVFNEEDILAEFVKRGLETRTAEAMTKFEVQEALKAFRSNPLVKQFAQGNLNANELRTELLRQGASSDSADEAVTWGRQLMTMERREKCLAAIRHKVLIGEIDEAAAAAEAFAQTNDQTQANELARTWACERDSRSKISTASELCGFFKDGLLAQGDFLRGLLRINMPLQRAQRLISRCQMQLTKSQEMEEERERKAAEAEARRLQREVDKASRLSESQMKQRESALEKANKARDRQEKRLVQATKTIANRHGLDYEELLPVIISIARRAVNDGLGKMEEISSIAQTISTSSAVTGPISFAEVLHSTLLEVG